ncbi:MAG: class I SAM-dependent methyltransferase [Bdellovibrionales bacterium]|nr:class I SAM-dependent methyltransferase [Bdellovibrionales bacterium]
MHVATLNDVKSFWEENPLFEGESRHSTGSREFFEEHSAVYVQDCFAGVLDERIFPAKIQGAVVLDLGCGPGFWAVELAKRGAVVTAADLTERALELTGMRSQIFNAPISIQLENAEQLSFERETFSHVNCQGVIHHTPNTEACVSEIARILKPGGTASISVYYRNLLLRNWAIIRPLGLFISLLGGKMKGRGREGIFKLSKIDDLVRVFDGAENPIGKAYTYKTFRNLLEPYFEVQEVFLHFFPARSLPFSLSPRLHRWLDAKVGFMIFANVQKL